MKQCVTFMVIFLHVARVYNLKFTFQSHNVLNLIVTHIFGHVQQTKIKFLSSQIDLI
jgi:hypothetical protein